MPQRYTFNKAEKLKSRKRIDLVFKKGRSFSVFPYKVFYRITPAGVPGSSDLPTNAVRSSSAATAGNAARSSFAAPAGRGASIQTGFGVSSRHFKKAVDRNRIKRLGREAWRLQKHPLTEHVAKKGCSMALFFVYTGKDLPDYPLITARFGVALQKLIKEIV